MRKKIEKEEKTNSREYAPIIKAFIVLIILVSLLVVTIIYQPTKKDEIQDPNVLSSDEKVVNTDTSCDGNQSKEIKKAADKITISYEVVDDFFFGYMAESDEDLNGNGVIDDDPVVENIGYALKVKLNNLTDKNYVTISNDIDDDIKTFHVTDENEQGIITWYESETVFCRTYNVKVYSNNEGCTDQVYREFKVMLPKFNTNSRSYDCFLDYTKDLDICQPFIFSNKTSREELKEFKRIIIEKSKEHEREEELKKEQEESKKDEVTFNNVVNKIIDYVNNNKLMFAIIFGAIVVLLVLFAVKKGRK